MPPDNYLNRARLGFYLSWPLLAGMMVSLLALTGGLDWKTAVKVVVPPSALFAVSCQSSWYLVKSIPLRKANLGRLLLSHSASAAILSGIWIASVDLWAMLVVPEQAGIREHLPVLFGVGVLYYLLAGAYHYLVRALQVTYEAEQRESAASLHARESELKALRAQINPHFLFNSLHSISALTTRDPAKARQMCILLGDFLRNTLGAGDKTTITVEEELNLARQYLRIEQVRFTDRLIVEESIDSPCLDCVMPPLLLQPLVENAIKHGVASLTTPVRLRLEVGANAGRLLISVDNDFDPDTPPKHATGVGLRNVKERLRAFYGDQAALRSEPHNGTWRAALLLPARKGQPE